MGRKWSSIAARESAWLPSYPTRLPSSSNWAAIAGASCWFQAMRISSYRRRIGWSDETVLVLDIQTTPFILPCTCASPFALPPTPVFRFTVGPYRKSHTMERAARRPTLPNFRELFFYLDFSHLGVKG